MGSDIDATFTKTACARFCPAYVQLSRRTKPHPYGALIDDEAAKRADTAASSTSPEATIAGRATVRDEEETEVTAADADRNVGEEPEPDVGPGLPNDVEARTESPAAAHSETPRANVSRRRSFWRLPAGDMDRMGDVPPFGPRKGSQLPHENRGVRESATRLPLTRRTRAVPPEKATGQTVCGAASIGTASYQRVRLAPPAPSPTIGENAGSAGENRRV